MISKIKIFIILTLIIVSIIGCSDDKEDPAYEEKIAVYAYLYVDEPVSHATVLVNKTLPIDDYYELQDAVVDAEVTLEKMGNRGTISNSWSFSAVASNPGYYATEDTTWIEETTTYRLTIEVEGFDTITAETTTPYKMTMLGHPPTIPPGTDSTEFHNYGISPYDLVEYPLIFRCENPEQFGMCDAYCEEEWYNAKYINSPPGLGDYPEEEEQYDGGPQGEPRHIFGFSRIKDLTKVDEMGEDVYMIEWYGGMIVFFGRYTISILTMDSNYHKYLYTEHPELNGGIENGIGVFGSASRFQYDIYVSE